MKIYTKTGDSGQTSLFTGKRVSKDHVLIESFGMLDELNSSIGSLLSTLNTRKKIRYRSILEVVSFLEDLQRQIFSVGSYLASECSDEKYIGGIEGWIKNMEEKMDQMDSELPKLTNFILPGGSIPSSKAHICRVLSRKTERHVVGFEQSLQTEKVIVYLNRLSDYFFVLARWFNHKLDYKELDWKP